MALLIARNYQRILYKKVLENRAKTVPFISTYNLLWFSYSFKKGRFFIKGAAIAPIAPLQLCNRNMNEPCRTSVMELFFEYSQRLNVTKNIRTTCLTGS